MAGGASPLTLTLRNGGSLAHDLRVRRGGRDVGGTGIFTPGQSQTVRLSLPPGSYQFLCTVGDHAQLGMRGTLIGGSINGEELSNPKFHPFWGQG